MLIITQDPADVITCSPIEAALALENVGLAVGSVDQKVEYQLLMPT